MANKTQQMTRTFGLNVRSARISSNLSQEMLAQQAGIYRTYLSRVESGLANPSLLVIAALAHALQVEPCQLMVDIGTDALDPQRQTVN
jgi:transcriptional regulator with XRE-family HTH domain